MREQIIREIRKLAEANGGVPPGKASFESTTGITEGAWSGVYWARWSEAVSEAGYKPNAKNEKLDENFLLEKVAAAARHYGKIPVSMEMRLYKKIDPDFPNEKTIYVRFGGRQKLLSTLAEWSRQSDDYKDIAAMLNDVPSDNALDKSALKEGLVYLIKSGSHYKIGRSDEIERRMKEIRIALPETANLIHSIRTDDPSGIEAYWHRRFADRRANGEWFKLTNADIAAFKRRKFQ